MSISVFGMGYVGAVTSACFAKLGFKVVGVDIDPAILRAISAGRAPIVERDLEPLIQAGIDGGRLTTSASAREAVAATDVSIVCVGTPSAADGKPDLTAADAVIRDIAEAIAAKDAPHTVVIRSTVLPGSTEERFLPALERISGRKVGDGLEVGFNPEFLREGVAVHDFFHPPFIVVGSVAPSGFAAIERLYAGFECSLFRTNCRLAESVKYLCNAFQAMKIAFANEAGALMRSIGVDGRDAMKICCADQVLNISPAYLRPGYAFGGSCLPKDLRAVMSLAASRDVELPLLGQILASNERHIERAAAMVRASGGAKVAMLGIAFKPGTDDLRESPLLDLAGRLIAEGREISIFDGNVDFARLNGENRRHALAKVGDLERRMCADAAAALAGADVIVVGNAGSAEVGAIAGAYRGQPVIDLQGAADLAALAGENYRGICW
jgi:GDP-mannose 6-dehydrogenase